MVITSKLELPLEEELTVKEVPVGSPALQAASFHFGKYCENQSNEFMMCRQELDDPRKCLDEGKAVTICALDFFRKMKEMCSAEFTQYANCLDKASPQMDFRFCRKTQAVFDKCVLDELGVERPYFGYYCRPRIHHTDRPKPPPEEPLVFPNPPDELPEDAPRKPSVYGQRKFFM